MPTMYPYDDIILSGQERFKAVLGGYSSCKEVDNGLTVLFMGYSLYLCR